MQNRFFVSGAVARPTLTLQYVQYSFIQCLPLAGRKNSAFRGRRFQEAVPVPLVPSRMKRLDRPSSSNYGRGYPYGGFRQAAPGFPSCTTSEAATGVSDFPGMAGFFPARARKRDPRFAALHQTPFQAIVRRTPCGMHAPARKSGPMTRLLQTTSRATRRISHAARSCTRIAHASQRLPSICRSP